MPTPEEVENAIKTINAYQAQKGQDEPKQLPKEPKKPRKTPTRQGNGRKMEREMPNDTSTTKVLNELDPVLVEKLMRLKMGESEDDEQRFKNLPPKALKSPFKVLEGKAAAREIRQMGNANAKWLKSEANGMNFKNRNIASIYRGDVWMRDVPFVLKNDYKMDLWWAIIDVHKFFGLSTPVWPWNWPSVKVLSIGLDLSEPYCENTGKDGRHIKIDEGAKCQLPMHITLSDTEKAKILKNNRMVGYGLLAKSTLEKLEKPRPNWIFWAIIGIIVIVVAGVIVLYATNPHIFTQLGQWFKNLGKTFMPPTTSGN